MVKGTSSQASNLGFRVQILVGVLVGFRLSAIGFRRPMADGRKPMAGGRQMNGVCGVAVSARLPVEQKVRVQLPPDTLN